jgi:hypothetical protein
MKFYIVAWSTRLTQMHILSHHWESFVELKDAKKKYKQLVKQTNVFNAHICEPIKSTEL